MTSPYGALSSLRIGPFGQGLQCRDVDHAGTPVLATAELPGRHPEELQQPGPPLVQQRLAGHQDQRGNRMPGDQRAGDDRLACTEWCDQHPELVLGQGIGGRTLLDAQLGGERELMGSGLGRLSVS